MEADYDHPVFQLLAAKTAKEMEAISANPQTLKAALKPYWGGHSPAVEQDSQDANELATLEADLMDAADATYKRMSESAQRTFSASLHALIPSLADDLMGMLGEY